MKSGQLIITDDSLQETVTEEQFTAFRIQNSIPLQGKDFTHKHLVMNVDPSLISWKKGCFLGQEVVARVNSYARPPKKLVVFCTKDAHIAAQLTSPVQTTEGTCGFLFVKN